MRGSQEALDLQTEAKQAAEKSPGFEQGPELEDLEGPDENPGKMQGKNDVSDDDEDNFEGEEV